MQLYGNSIYGELWATRNRPRIMLGRAAASRTAIDRGDIMKVPNAF